MKAARDVMDIVNAYQSVGMYRGAAALWGTTHKSVRRVLERLLPVAKAAGHTGALRTFQRAVKQAKAAWKV